jgi:hypothetical protein
LKAKSNNLQTLGPPWNGFDTPALTVWPVNQSLWVGLSREGAGCLSQFVGFHSCQSISVGRTLREGGRLVILSEMSVVYSFNLVLLWKKREREMMSCEHGFPVEKQYRIAGKWVYLGEDTQTPRQFLHPHFYTKSGAYEKTYKCDLKNEAGV